GRGTATHPSSSAPPSRSNGPRPAISPFPLEAFSQTRRRAPARFFFHLFNKDVILPPEKASQLGWLRNGNASPWAVVNRSGPGKTVTLHTPLDKGPRLDKYARLLHRFFEPLVLLHTLGKTRGIHSPASVEEGSIEFEWKTFLDDLSYVCDYDKGGHTTTAIAIEAGRDRYVFWFALNKSSARVHTFLESILATITESIQPVNAQNQETRDELMANLKRRCFEHARHRIKKEVNMLRTHIKRCTGFLSGEDDAELARWLEQFRQGDHSEVCSLAFEHRQSQEMLDIKNRGRQSRYITRTAQDKRFDSNPFANPFAAAHHLIGRLAHHERAPKRLMESAQCFEQVLDSSYVVSQVPVPEPVPAPVPDDKTNLCSILHRMGVDDEATTEALMDLERMHGIEEPLLEEYRNDTFKPIVHCEIQVYEHFNAPGRQKLFALDLPVIGCSKAACYCCKLYLKYSPARCIQPESHENVWLNWSPPALPSGHLDAGFRSQRAVLQGMIEEIRRAAVAQILERRGPGTSHPDSTTGITKLTARNPVRARDAGQSIAALSIQSPAEYLDWGGGSEYGFDEDAARSPSRPGSPARSESSETRSSLDFAPSPESRSPDADLGGPDFDSDDDDGGGVLLFTPRKQNWPRI
ncbi:hypothetical protein RB594_007420, partial [Gaeumannomyces avenae]